MQDRGHKHPGLRLVPGQGALPPRLPRPGRRDRGAVERRPGGPLPGVGESEACEAQAEGRPGELDDVSEQPRRRGVGGDSHG